MKNENEEIERFSRILIFVTHFLCGSEHHLSLKFLKNDICKVSNGQLG